ncbi:MAG TPA: tetratricopeptide repeat protein [bacterium]|nr:tetratricopeptide repeat protein [bacterium]
MARLTPREEAKLRQYEDLLRRESHALIFAPLASLYARQFDFQKAVDVLRRGLAIYPNYFSAHVLLARCYIALDNFDAAAADLESVLGADPYNVSALGLLGDEMRNRGRLAEARDHYLKILEIEPDNEEYAYKLELLNTLIEGSPFAREAEVAVEEAEAITPPTPEVIEVPPVPPEVEEVETAPVLEEAELAAAQPAEAGPAAAELEEAEAGPEEIATLTLAKIYEDQGFFVRAREVIDNVLAREPDNAAALEARDHMETLVAGEESPTGASVVRLIQKVEAVSGLLEHDELELWEEVSAGVEDALSGFEEITVAQAVAAAAGLRSFDDFTLGRDNRAAWELDMPGVAATAGEAGAEEMDVELPLSPAFDGSAGVNVAELAARAAPGIAGEDLFSIGLGETRAEGVDSVDLAGVVPARKGETGAEEFALPAGAEAAAPVEEAAEVGVGEAAGEDELAVRPERYQPRKPLELEREPFEKDEDFLSWLDSIKLKEL